MSMNLCCNSSLFNTTKHTSKFNFNFPARKIALKPLNNSNSEQLSVENNSQKPQTLQSKSKIWVNPKSPRASRLRKTSYNSRYSALIKLAESLDTCQSNEACVFEVLNGSDFGDLIEQDAVVVINNMRNAENALLVLRWFQSKLRFGREVVLYNVTLKVFRKCKDLAGAERVFEEMVESGVRPDNATFRTLITCARICNLPEKGVEWFEKMSGFGCDPDGMTYSAMIDVYGRVGDSGMAFGLYDRARTEKWKIDHYTFSTLIRVYSMEGNFDGCLNIYQEMKALGVKPNLVIYNILLDAMGRAKRPWQAKSIYKDMVDDGFAPSWVTYAALLRAFCRARYGEDAFKVYREMKEKGLELNVVLYNTVLSMCADLGTVDEAVEIYNDLKACGTCEPDSWTFSSMITTYACSGKVLEAETVLNEMIEAGFETNIFVLTSLMQCYGKVGRTDDVVKTFNQVLELNITPDDRFYGCLLNVLTQTPKDEVYKVVDCIEKANTKLGSVIRLLIEKQDDELIFRKEASELFDSISYDVKKAYCNCLIDLCVNLNLLERGCELLDLGLSLEIYKDIQAKSPTLWSLHLKSLSLGAAQTALHVWMNDLSKTLTNGEELPPLLGINTGHGKHKYSDKGLSGVINSRLKELNAPFHEAPDQVGWFLTTKDAAKSWLESKNSPELVAA